RAAASPQPASDSSRAACSATHVSSLGSAGPIDAGSPPTAALIASNALVPTPRAPAQRATHSPSACSTSSIRPSGVYVRQASIPGSGYPHGAFLSTDPLGFAAVAGRLNSRLALLRHSRFRLLFVATFTSGIGNWLAVVALQVDVYDRTQSGWWVGALLVVNVLPAVFLGLLLGPVVDRFSRKGLMIGSDLGRLAVFAVLPFTHSAMATVALAAAAGIGNAFFRPAVLA